MNFDFYILGTPDGYNQYPLDDKAELFQSFHNDVNADTQMTIWRKANIVYYVYIRNLRTAGKNQYFGMVIAINGLYLADIGNVFSVFEQVCSNIALRGRILKIDPTGKIKFVHSRFIDTPDEIDTTIRECREQVALNLQSHIKPLPEEYVVPYKATTIAYDDSFNEGKLNNLLKDYNCIHFTKAEKGDAGYIDMVVTRLYEENRKLKEQYNTLNSQKKQYKIVMLLLILLLGLCVGVFFMNHYIHEKHVEIEARDSTISNQSVLISGQKNSIKQLKIENQQLSQMNNLLQEDLQACNDSLTMLQQHLSEQQAQLSELQDEKDLLQMQLDGYLYHIGQQFPIIIKSVQIGNFYSDGTKETDYGNTIYSYYSSYLQPKIKFRGLKSGNIYLSMRLYLPNGRLWRDSQSPANYSRTARLSSTMNEDRVSENNTFRIGGSRGYWSRGLYRIEFWYNDRICLYSGTFNIE